MGTLSFRVGAFRRKATDFTLHVDLGGVAGVIAPIVGKTACGLPYLAAKRGSAGIRSRGRTVVLGRADLEDGTNQPVLPIALQTYFVDCSATKLSTTPASSLAITCGNNYLTAVEICLDKNLEPENCTAVKTCGANQLRIPAPQ